MSNRIDWTQWILEKNTAHEQEELKKSDSVVLESLIKVDNSENYKRLLQEAMARREKSREEKEREENRVIGKLRGGAAYGGANLTPEEVAARLDPLSLPEHPRYNRIPVGEQSVSSALPEEAPKAKTREEIAREERVKEAKRTIAEKERLKAEEDVKRYVAATEEAKKQRQHGDHLRNDEAMLDDLFPEHKGNHGERWINHHLDVIDRLKPLAQGGDPDARREYRDAVLRVNNGMMPAHEQEMLRSIREEIKDRQKTVRVMTPEKQKELEDRARQTYREHKQDMIELGKQGLITPSGKFKQGRRALTPSEIAAGKAYTSMHINAEGKLVEGPKVRREEQYRDALRSAGMTEREIDAFVQQNVAAAQKKALEQRMQKEPEKARPVDVITRKGGNPFQSRVMLGEAPAKAPILSPEEIKMRKIPETSGIKRPLMSPVELASVEASKQMGGAPTERDKQLMQEAQRISARATGQALEQHLTGGPELPKTLKPQMMPFSEQDPHRFPPPNANVTQKQWQSMPAPSRAMMHNIFQQAEERKRSKFIDPGPKTPYASGITPGEE